MQSSRLAVLICLALLWCNSAVLAQDAKRWTYHEVVDDFTDKRTRHIFVKDSTESMTLVISAVDGEPGVAILMPAVDVPGTVRVPVEYRIDQGAVVTEQWIFTNKIMLSESPGASLRRLQTGSRLRLRMRSGTKEGPTLEFDIRGLAEVLPRLGLPVAPT